MTMRHLLSRHYLACLALVVLLCIGTQAISQAVPQDNDTTRGELATMDRFMDSHPEIAGQLRKDPSLVNNKEFVENHPALQQLLREHPGVREEFSENPNAFMKQEGRFDRQEDRDDSRRRELAGLDQFMDGHPEVAQQLRKNPSLVKNKEFLEDHPALQQYLSEHPGVREQLTENPNAFMKQENRFDQREGNRDDSRRRELANLDQFMDSHPEIAEQLRRNPSLVNNQEFVENHPALQQYLREHPAVREQFTENPNAFMKQEDRFDQREDNRMNSHDHDTTRGELVSFNEFLGGHSEIAQQLSKDPSLVKNQEYMENHPQLQQYLQAHPEVHEELSENPQLFMRSAQQLSSSGTTKMGTTVDVKPKPKQ